MEDHALMKAAWAARERAYAPYSKFRVGAALLTESGEVFRGANVENLSFGLTICAERSAVCTAIMSGVRQFRTIAIVSDSQEPISPCGACRQVLAEFGVDLRVISENVAGDWFEGSLAELLPRARTGILDRDTRPKCSM